MIIILLLVGVFPLTFNVQPVQANGTTYVRSSGSVNQPTVNAGSETAMSGSEVTIAYDDGTMENAYYWTGAGGIFAVRFTPSLSGQLKRCSFYIGSDPASVKIHVMNSSKVNVITPFTYSVTITGWINVDLLAYGVNVTSGVDFYIGLEWTVANAPTLGADTSSPDSRSWSWNGVVWSLKSDRDYMIRAIAEVEEHADIDVDPLHLDFYAQAATSTPSSVRENCSSIDDNRTVYPVMQPDNGMLQEWVNLYNSAPHAYIDSESALATGSFSLIDHLEYIPSERNQGSCGNCWVWAGTGVMEVALDVQEEIKDRLSVQYFTSCWHGGVPNDWACCGGNLEEFADWYQDNEFVIPWSNTNAYWQDGNRSEADGTSVPGSTIATSPNYTLSLCTTETVETQGVGQAQAIANIKNVLHQNKAIYFSYFLPNSGDWNVFFSFWNNQPESAVWSPDYSNGHTWSPLSGGGHAVLCIGYNDTDPNNSYWIMVNSWGTAGGGRPNGIFHINMTMNYDCWLNGLGYSLEFQTLDVNFEIGSQSVTISNVGNVDLEVTSIQCDQPWLSVSQPCPPSFVMLSEENHTVWIHVDPTGLYGGVYYGNVQIYSNDPDENPVTVTVTLYVGERACLAVRGQNNLIYYRTYNITTASWADWNALPGATCDNPAAKICGNELHFVVRGIDGNTLWHGYINLMNQVFSGWTLISGSTPSAPTLTSNGTAVGLVVRGQNNLIYGRFYMIATRTWTGWAALPSGATCDSPAAAILGNELHIVVRGMDGNTLWHSSADLSTGVFSGWDLVGGATESKPTLATCEPRNEVILVVRGLNNVIYRNSWTISGWAGWVGLPTGSTCDGVGATAIGETLHAVVRGTDGNSLWHGSTDLASNTFSGWTLISGSTPSTPTLTS